MTVVGKDKYKTEYKGQQAWLLENERLSVVVVPGLGGKLASLYFKDKAFELLYQNHRPAICNASFEEGEACGFDDTFPSIQEEAVWVNGESIRYPDHGEIWKSRMTVLDRTEESISLGWESGLLPYYYEKRIALTHSGVKLHYRITNTGNYAFPCIWTMHCLVRFEEDMKLYYPAGTAEFENVLEGGSLGRIGTKFACGEASRDWAHAAGTDPMCKYYVSHPVTEGRCGYEYPSQGVKCEIRYRAEALPYLGVWITRGGFRGEYNMAMEPSNGYYDGIQTALANDKCPKLQPKEQMEFEIAFAFIRPDHRRT